VLVADQPFATLDPTTRRMELPSGTVMLLSDTVGFVNKLPPTLVAAFRATLEELQDADLLVHVVDVSHPNLHERMTVVRETLGDLGLAERPSLVVMNKSDALRGAEGAALHEALAGEFPAAVFVSAQTGAGIDELRERLASAAAAGWRHVRVRLPHSAGGLLQRIRERGSLRSAEYVEGGIDVDAEVPPSMVAELEASGASAARGTRRTH
jgi:GTP-binding protein HflX